MITAKRSPQIVAPPPAAVKRSESQTTQRGSRRTRLRLEVDAIPPNTLRQIVSDAIDQHIDQPALELTRQVEASEREVLTRMIGGEWW